jgi:hypothetical protein
MTKTLPLILTEIYLLLGLLLFVFGPIQYNLENSFQFWIYIGCYHAAFVWGYMAGLRPLTFRQFGTNQRLVRGLKTRQITYLLLFGIAASLIGHQNLTLSESIIPYNLPAEVLAGLRASSDQYLLKIDNLSYYQGNKFLNIVYFFIAFAKIATIPAAVFYWESMTKFQRPCALVVSVFPVLSGVAAGTNKPIFDFLLVAGASLSLFFMSNYFRTGEFGFRHRRRSTTFVALLLVFGLSFFGTAMEGRGGSTLLIESSSPDGNVRISDEFAAPTDFLSYIFVYLSFYLVHGYYGFSQALYQDFDSTYGFGNSQFLIRQIDWLTGIDLFPYTYQFKINAVWDATGRWHSIYSYIANDVHFIGVVFWNFLIAFLFSKVWMSLIRENNLYAKFLLPLFFVMIIFMPANNQVFGFLETFSAFLIGLILWLRSSLRGYVFVS